MNTDIATKARVTTTPIPIPAFNNKLYGMERVNFETYRVLLFNPDLGDFEPLGNPFVVLNGSYKTLTIDGNNERVIYTTSNSQNGSTVIIADGVTGELINQFQTISIYKLNLNQSKF